MRCAADIFLDDKDGADAEGSRKQRVLRDLASSTSRRSFNLCSTMPWACAILKQVQPRRHRPANVSSRLGLCLMRDELGDMDDPNFRKNVVLAANPTGGNGSRFLMASTQVLLVIPFLRVLLPFC